MKEPSVAKALEGILLRAEAKRQSCEAPRGAKQDDIDASTGGPEACAIKIKDALGL